MIRSQSTSFRRSLLLIYSNYSLPHIDKFVTFQTELHRSIKIEIFLSIYVIMRMILGSELNGISPQPLMGKEPAMVLAVQ